MAVVGITGNIASGKSTFRDLLASLTGARTFDADAAAKEFLAHDPEVRRRVVAELGPDAYLCDGTPDRDWIRHTIFGNPEAKARLESVLHPAVRRAWTEIAEGAAHRTGHFLVDIPLLFETGADQSLAFVVTVACSPAIQRSRLAARGLDGTTAEKIIASQMPQAEKIARSAVVVWNDGSLAALRMQAASIAARLSSPGGLS